MVRDHGRECGFWVSGLEQRIGGNEPRLKSWFILVTYCPGYPLPWNPLALLLPRFLQRASLNHPHPLGKGRGAWGCILACEGAETLVIEPTSLNREEGLVVRLLGVVAGELWQGGWWWWWKEERRMHKSQL